MPNIHTPERGADESRAAYADRRKASKAAVKTMTAAAFGDQHKMASSRQQFRDQRRKNGNGPKGVYGSSLMAHYAKRFAELSALRLQKRALT